MAARMDPVTEQLLARLTWDWQDLGVIIQELIPVVAPGKALRSYDTQTHHRRRRDGVGQAVERSEAERIAMGARQIVNDRIAAQRNSGRIEVEGSRDEGRRVRLRDRRSVDRSVPEPTQDQDGGTNMFTSRTKQAAGQEPDKADIALNQVHELYSAWGQFQRTLKEWKDQILGEVREVKRKQSEQARITQGQVESILAKISSLDIDAPEVTQEIADLRGAVNALRETTLTLSGNVTGQEEALTRLVARLSGAVTATEVFGSRGD